jgi:hypothetical protein
MEKVQEQNTNILCSVYVCVCARTRMCVCVERGIVKCNGQ